MLDNQRAKAAPVKLALRRWPEATYVGLSVGVLVCSTLIVSAPRYALTWFPAYLLLAQVYTGPGGGGCAPADTGDGTWTRSA